MEKNYWLHRCSCGENAWSLAQELLKKHNLISIGWSDFSKNNYPERIVTSFESFEEAFKEVWKVPPRHRYNLWRFLSMKDGDIVVVPISGMGTFDVYQLVDNVVYNNTNIDQNLWVDMNGKKASINENGYPAYADGRQIDIGFYRKVNCVAADIPRQEYTKQKLYSRMKVQLSTVSINDLKEEVDFALLRFLERSPINLHNTFLKCASNGLLTQMQELLNDIKLEQLVKWYMEQLGADAVIPPKNSACRGEGDADVIATFSKINDFTIYIQVKAHQGYTDEWAVKQIATYKKTIEKKGILGSHQLWVISTCKGFSETAKLDAKETNVHLVDGLDFSRMLVENGIYSLPL